jgi:hypothetical protein
MAKKPYSTPKLTDHGSVVKETKGLFGDAFEPIGRDNIEDGRLTAGFTKPVDDK